MVMLRNIMEGRFSFTSPEWDDITGNARFIWSYKKTYRCISRHSCVHRLNGLILSFDLHGDRREIIHRYMLQMNSVWQLMDIVYN